MGRQEIETTDRNASEKENTGEYDFNETPTDQEELFEFLESTSEIGNGNGNCSQNLIDHNQDSASDTASESSNNIDCDCDSFSEQGDIDTKSTTEQEECDSTPENSFCSETTSPPEGKKNDYSIVKIIGRGNYGTVFLARRLIDNRDVVIKEINFLDMSEEEHTEALNEVNILKMVRHPNIIEYYDSFEEEGSLNIVMEYAEGGELATYLKEVFQKKGFLFPESLIWSWFSQITSALHSIHCKGILHRDLKAQNIFLCKDKKTIKVGDFGISKKLTSTSQMAKTRIGTPYYLSPEICEEKPYDQKSDVWSLGCILYEISTGRHPFEGNSLPALVMKILKGSYPSISRRFSSRLHSMISRLLCVNPKRRPSIPSLLKSEKRLTSANIQGIMKKNHSLEKKNSYFSHRKDHFRNKIKLNKNNTNPNDQKNEDGDTNETSSELNSNSNSNGIMIDPPSRLQQPKVNFKKVRAASGKPHYNSTSTLYVQKSNTQQNNKSLTTQADLRVHSQNFKKKIKEVKPRISKHEKPFQNMKNESDKPIDGKSKPFQIYNGKSGAPLKEKKKGVPQKKPVSQDIVKAKESVNNDGTDKQVKDANLSLKDIMKKNRRLKIQKEKNNTFQDVEIYYPGAGSKDRDIEEAKIKLKHQKEMDHQMINVEIYLDKKSKEHLQIRGNDDENIQYEKLSSTIEHLRQQLEEELGFELFYNIYNIMKDKDKNQNDNLTLSNLDNISSLLGEEKQKFILTIQQLLHFEQIFFK